MHMLFSLEVYVDFVKLSAAPAPPEEPWALAFTLLDLEPVIVAPPPKSAAAASSPLLSYRRGKRCVFEHDAAELRRLLRSSAISVMLVRRLSEKQARLTAACAITTADFGPPRPGDALDDGIPVAKQWGYVSLLAPLKDIEGTTVAHANLTVSLNCLGAKTRRQPQEHFLSQGDPHQATADANSDNFVPPAASSRSELPPPQRTITTTTATRTSMAPCTTGTSHSTNTLPNTASAVAATSSVAVQTIDCESGVSQTTAPPKGRKARSSTALTVQSRKGTALSPPDPRNQKRRSTGHFSRWAKGEWSGRTKSPSLALSTGGSDKRGKRGVPPHRKPPQDMQRRERECKPHWPSSISQRKDTLSKVDCRGELLYIDPATDDGLGGGEKEKLSPCFARKVGPDAAPVLGKLFDELCLMERRAEEGGGSPSLLGKMFLEIAAMQYAILRERKNCHRRQPKKSKKGKSLAANVTRTSARAPEFRCAASAPPPPLSEADEAILLAWFEKHRQVGGTVPRSSLEGVASESLPEHLSLLLRYVPTVGDEISWTGVMEHAHSLSKGDAQSRAVPAAASSSVAAAEACGEGKVGDLQPQHSVTEAVADHAKEMGDHGVTHGSAGEIQLLSSDDSMDEGVRGMLQEGKAGFWSKGRSLLRRRSWFEEGSTPKSAVASPSALEPVRDFSLPSPLSLKGEADVDTAARGFSASSSTRRQRQARRSSVPQELEIEEYDSDFD